MPNSLVSKFQYRVISRFVYSQFQLDANYNDFSTASNLSDLKDEIIRNVAKWGGLTNFIDRIPKENIIIRAGSLLKDGYK